MKTLFGTVLVLVLSIATALAATQPRYEINQYNSDGSGGSIFGPVRVISADDYHEENKKTTVYYSRTRPVPVTETTPTPEPEPEPEPEPDPEPDPADPDPGEESYGTHWGWITTISAIILIAALVAFLVLMFAPKKKNGNKKGADTKEKETSAGRDVLNDITFGRWVEDPVKTQPALPGSQDQKKALPGDGHWKALNKGKPPGPTVTPRHWG